MDNNLLQIIETESNDTLSTADTVALSSDAPKAIAAGSLNFDFENNRDVDATEDVDLYAFELAAGDTIKLDVDSAGGFNSVDNAIDFAGLILFDSDGNNLAQGRPNEPAPEDAFISSLPYLEYTATEAGTYYAGVSVFLNGGTIFAPGAYDPFIAGSGNGILANEVGDNSLGEYTLGFELVHDATPIAEPPEPPTIGTPPADAPTVSLRTITGTYDVDGSIIAPTLAETVSDRGLNPRAGFGGSAIAFILEIDGAIPPEGVEVILNSDANLADYVNTNIPFVRGGEPLGPVLDADGNPSGIRLKLTEGRTFVNLNAFDKPTPETDGPEQVTFSLESIAANISATAAESTVTFYDTLADIPSVTSDLTVGLTVENGALVEADGNQATLTFDLSEPPPADGALVYVNLAAQTAGVRSPDGQSFGLLGEFDVFNAEITGGDFPLPDFASSGFYFNITEQTAMISIAAFADEEVEGVQAFQVSLGGSADYQVDADASTVGLTLADTAESLPQISLRTEPTLLIESEQTASIHTFTLSSPPPAGGVQVSVTAEGLEEFDLSGIATTGITGDISVAESDPSQLLFTVTEETATITLPVADDNASEGLESATFTLNPSEVYQVDPLAASSNFQIVETPADVPTPPVETASNNTLETAMVVNFSAANPIVVDGEVNYVIRTFADLSISPVVDTSEDVDLFSFELGAGESIEVTVDATTDLDGSDSLLKPVLRLFDTEGNELDTVGQVDSLADISAEPGEAALTFTAAAAGTYYAGISALGNDDYDPDVSGSGSGWLIEDVAEPGAYQVRFSQSADLSDQTLVGTAADESLEAGSGNDTVAGGLGNDVMIGGAGDDVLRGDANSRSPQDGEAGGDDIIFGGEGSDRIGGKAGNDILSGDAGDDFIWGDDGDDILMGVTGNDVLVGDNMSGGSGSDLFVFGNGDGTDTIVDFEVGIDRIGLVDGELTFADLTITQDGNNTLLGVAGSGETIAVLNGVQASSLTESSFEVLPDVSNPEEALVLI